MPPYYDYVCEEGHEFTADQKITEDPVNKCPECDAPCKRLISKTFLYLKGSGWARDGYSKK
jgi:putative FmdB family regulatory protein